MVKSNKKILAGLLSLEILAGTAAGAVAGKYLERYDHQRQRADEIRQLKEFYDWRDPGYEKRRQNLIDKGIKTWEQSQKRLQSLRDSNYMGLGGFVGLIVSCAGISVIREIIRKKQEGMRFERKSWLSKEERNVRRLFESLRKKEILKNLKRKKKEHALQNIENIERIAKGFSQNYKDMVDILGCVNDLYEIVSNRNYPDIILNCIRNKINLNNVRDKNYPDTFLEMEDVYLARFRGGNYSFELPKYRPWIPPCFCPEIEAESTWREKCKRAKEEWEKSGKKKYDQLKTLIFTLLDYKRNYRGFSLEDEVISRSVAYRNARSFSDHRKRYSQDWPLKFVTYEGVMTDKALTSSYQEIGAIILYENDESYKWRWVHDSYMEQGYAGDFLVTPERDSRDYPLYAKVVPKS